MSDSNTRFVIGAGLFTIFIVGGTVYLLSAYMSRSLPFQQWEADTSYGQSATVANDQGAPDTQKSSSLTGQFSPVVKSTPVDQNNKAQIILPVVQEASKSSGPVTDKSTAPVGDGIVAIRAFKATMFSDLTEKATELPVGQGTRIKLLEQKGEWVKIEVVQGGAIGYIHSSYFDVANSNSNSGQ